MIQPMRLHLHPILLILLTGCGGSCNPQGSIPPPGTDAKVARSAGRMTATADLTTAYQWQPPLRASELGTLVQATAPAQPFSPGELNKRFWLLVGPHGVTVAERDVLGPGPLEKGAIRAQLAPAIEDWNHRSGVSPRSALLLLDQAVDLETARMAVAEVQSAQAWAVTTLFAADTQTDALVEVALPGLNAARP